MLYLKVLLVLICLIAVSKIQSVHGCRPEVCRKRRAAVEQKDVLLELRGCSGRTKPWVSQLAYCVNVSTFEVASRMSDWYVKTYERCRKRCNDVRVGTNNPTEIAFCTDCFFWRSNRLQESFPTVNISEAVYPCIKDFVNPSLSDALPTFAATSQNNDQASGRVTLPEQRPADSWYSLTVRLPCKPPVFRYLNAFCINSFDNDARSRDFVLAQNRLVTDDGITFLVKFSDTCRFDISDITIIWDKSVAGFAFPQLSSFPSNSHPTRPEQGNLYFDTDAFRRYERTVGSNVEGTITEKPRKKRNAENNIAAPEIGIAIPCKVDNFLFYDEFGNRILTKSKGTRFLLEPIVLIKKGRKLERKALQNYGSLNFTLDFGYEKTGCVFSSNDVRTQASPSKTWLDADERVLCKTCKNAESEAECTGETLCQKGEICQSEIRQVNVNPNKISITKSCKQMDACENNWINNGRRQCVPGKKASVCRCCCAFDRCNNDGYHCT